MENKLKKGTIIVVAGAPIIILIFGHKVNLLVVKIPTAVRLALGFGMEPEAGLRVIFLNITNIRKMLFFWRKTGAFTRERVSFI